jgi:uncharacterized protein YhfF
MHPSVARLWQAFTETDGAPAGLPSLPTSVFYFCDNPADANLCADLVMLGRKRATAPSLWGLEARGEPVPTPGEHHVVTDWEGVARCVIQTIAVEVLPFADVTAVHAAAEGEGDGSLEYWRTAHWAYYQRELAGTSFVPTVDMPIVFERFEVVYPSTDHGHADRKLPPP